jgi:hypothetical protein
VGLPEDVCHARQALAAGLAVLVVWPVDRAFPGQYCWSAKDDGRHIVRVLEEFVAAHPPLADSPVYALGASSGGSVALKLPGFLAAFGTKGLRLKGVVAEVSSKTPVQDIVDGVAPRDLPPVVWVAMGNNPGEIANVKARVAEYGRVGARAAMVVSPPRPVSPTFFSDRHAQITPEVSAAIVEAMKRTGLVDARGRVARDLRKDRAWAPQLQRELQARMPWMAGDPLYALRPTKASPLLQALGVADARHEHVCDYLTAALEWFQRGGSFEELVAARAVGRPADLWSRAAPASRRQFRQPAA